MNTDQLLNTASSVVLTALTKAGATLEQVQQVQAAVVNFVHLAEQTGKTGEEKLAAVLNATEAYVAAQMPTLKVDFTNLSDQVKSFVAGVVSLFNALKVFVHDVEKTVAGAIQAAKDALTAGEQPASPPAPPAPAPAA